MASVSVSHLILFIASLLVAVSVAGTLTTGVDRMTAAISDRSLDVSEKILTDVEIISDPGGGTIYNETAGTVTLLVKNTGSKNLRGSDAEIDVLVNGRYQVDVSVTVIDDEDWVTGSVVRVVVDTDDVVDGDNRVSITVNGDREVLRFRA